MSYAVNPVLKGFHPDPSICRVKDVYYIACSTFEWYPGVAVYRSSDLLHWEAAARPLDALSKLDMYGNPPSAGVWAPCLSHDGIKFHLVYTNTRFWIGSRGGLNDGFKDTPNFLVTAESIDGPWSEPVYLNSSGFDPSLFHDDDGRKWLVNLQWDYRCGKNHFSSIVLQEYDAASEKLTGERKNIFSGTDIGFTEGPHLYKRNGYYYLMTAEGGTSYGHAVTVARSKNIEGPYEVHPENPMLSSVSDRELFMKTGKEGLHQGLQKAGHASMCEYDGDVWVLAHLCSRPLDGTPFCPLGRETALQKVMWGTDGWPRVEGNRPSGTVSFTDEERPPRDSVSAARNITFNSDEIDMQLMSLRGPASDFASLTERRGWIRIHGRESVSSAFRQSLLAKRIQSTEAVYELQMDFTPRTFNDMAGLIIRYDEGNQVYLRMSYDETIQSCCVGILSLDRYDFSMPLQNEIPVSPGQIFMRAELYGGKFRFSVSSDGNDWMHVGPEFDLARLSDDYVEPMGFTGAFAGFCCQDLNGSGVYADFRYFKSVENIRL